LPAGLAGSPAHTGRISGGRRRAGMPARGQQLKLILEESARAVSQPGKQDSLPGGASFLALRQTDRETAGWWAGRN